MSLLAYLLSVDASTSIVQSLLPTFAKQFQNIHYGTAPSLWKHRSCMETAPLNSSFQSNWDRPVSDAAFNSLLKSAGSDAEKARLLSISAESASVWLNAIPIQTLGVQMDPLSLKIACGLHIGSTLCHQHKCICGVVVDPKGRHGLACKKQKGRHM